MGWGIARWGGARGPENCLHTLLLLQSLILNPNNSSLLHEANEQVSKKWVEGPGHSQKGLRAEARAPENRLHTLLLLQSQSHDTPAIAVY